MKIYKLNIFLKSDVFILVITPYVAQNYLQRGDGSSQIYATINAPTNGYANGAAFALVNGELHVFGGNSDSNKVLFCLTNQKYEICKKIIGKFNYQISK